MISTGERSTDAAGSIDDTRQAVVIAAWGLTGAGVYTIACQALGWLDVPIVPIVAILGTLVLVNVALARTASDWAGNATAAWTYESLHAIAHTVLIHLYGGISAGPAVMVYGFLIVHTEVLRPDASVFVTANVCAICYAILGLLEQQGWITSPNGPFVAMSRGDYLAFISFAVLAFNFLALYANRHGLQLRRLAARLQERTTELQQVNRRLAQTAAALETKQGEVRTFVYAVTHDLKGPLGAIGLRTDLVLDGARERLMATEREQLEQVLQTADRTQAMIHDLLEMFRVTSVEEPPAWVDLERVVHRSVDALGPQIDAKGITIDVEPLPRVWGQQRKLEHLVANLLGNAVKYVPAHHGRVTVRATPRGGDIVLSVGDNGVGIDPIYHRRIFEPFGRAPREAQVVDGAAVPGSGIGLAVVQQIAEAHAGEAWVESMPGSGATFHIRLGGPPHRDAVQTTAGDLPATVAHEDAHA